ncbi:hypothetical protein [Neomicrococcus aestuarii]|uniref:Uncharacterized protein n=1 Tax=Neomicrococcus aestuarii TaxID=556325 RepID=A0A1L2ZNP7_9MICC|nr:hypothetical protein [Neomicrococcus aestuarii]APF40847.1 hypothetical protein BHE16_07270 [Neomicrococcus aestuarii]
MQQAQSPAQPLTISRPTVGRRPMIGAGLAWTAATILAAGPAPAFAASSTNLAGQYVTLADTQSANTDQGDTNATTWPHGLITDENPELKQVKFQLGMQMMIFNEAMYKEVGFDTYKNWVSGPITVRLTFDNTVYKLLDNQSTWIDLPDNGGSAWTWTSTSTIGTWTTLTFTHSQIAYNGNTLGVATQTGVFEILFELLRNPGVQQPPTIQPANGRTVTNSMQINVSSSLQDVTIPYVQENSSQLY